MEQERSRSLKNVTPLISGSSRDEHGSGLDWTGSGLKLIFGGSGLDRTQKIWLF